ncbi:hypothetical protein [Nonomuraea sp. NPDC049784]|uniref:hypothetical protein n=1 Tax=Nonomuraea sp. NPDC049784 TaxID=3154361 RepID=UPI0033C9EC82
MAAQHRYLVPQDQLSRSEIAALVTEIGDMARAITEDSAEFKNETYRRMGLRLTYHPDQTNVRAEIHLSPHIVKRYVSED